MLEHATYLECIALRLHHNAIQTISATLAGATTAKIVDLPESIFGADLPTRNDEETEAVTSEEEEHLPKVGTISQAAAQSADIAKFAQPSNSSSTTLK